MKGMNKEQNQNSQKCGNFLEMGNAKMMNNKQ